MLGGEQNLLHLSPCVEVNLLREWLPCLHCFFVGGAFLLPKGWCFTPQSGKVSLKEYRGLYALDNSTIYSVGIIELCSGTQL